MQTGILHPIFYGKIRSEMEMGNVSKRQQPDQRAENSRRPTMGLRYREKIPHPGGGGALAGP